MPRAVTAVPGLGDLGGGFAGLVGNMLGLGNFGFGNNGHRGGAADVGLGVPLTGPSIGAAGIYPYQTDM